jgi:hypothetical protein
MAPADNQLAAVKALAAQAGAGPADRQALVASGAVPKLAKHLSSKTAAVVSQSALALSLLASDPSTRPSLCEHLRALVPAVVQTLKSGGPLTLARSLATLAALIQHVPKAGAAVIKANGIVPLLRIAQTGSEELQEAAVSVLDAFHMRAPSLDMLDPAEQHTSRALAPALELLEPLIRTLSVGPQGAKLFALRVLRIMSGERMVVQAIRRPALTSLLLGFASAEDIDIASEALVGIACALRLRSNLGPVAPEDAAYRASPKLSELCASLPPRLQSPHEAMVDASLQYALEMCGTPGIHANPWFCQCIQDIPRLLANGSHAIKVWGLGLAGRAWFGWYDSWDGNSQGLYTACAYVKPCDIPYLWTRLLAGLHNVTNARMIRAFPDRRIVCLPC